MRQKNEKGYRVVWHGMKDEKTAKAFYQTLLEFRARPVKFWDLEPKEILLSLIKEHINEKIICTLRDSHRYYFTT